MSESNEEPQASIVIGGRSFQLLTDGTAEWDVFLRRHLVKAGLRELHMGEGETAEAFSVRILDELSLNADVFALLGGTLLPAEMDVESWSPAVATQTGDFLRKLRGQQDRNEIWSQVGRIIAGFVRAELSSVMISPRYSVRRSQQHGAPLVSPPNSSDAPASPGESGRPSSVA